MLGGDPANLKDEMWLEEWKVLGGDPANLKYEMWLEKWKVGIRTPYRIKRSLRRGLPVKNPEDAALALRMVPRQRRLELLSLVGAPVTLLVVAGMGISFGGQAGLFLVILGLISAPLAILIQVRRLRNLTKAERASRAIFERLGVEFYRGVRKSRLEARPLPPSPGASDFGS